MNKIKFLALLVRLDVKKKKKASKLLCIITGVNWEYNIWVQFGGSIGFYYTGKEGKGMLGAGSVSKLWLVASVRISVGTQAWRGGLGKLAKSAETTGMEEPLKDFKWFVCWMKQQVMWQLDQRLVRKDGIWEAGKELSGGRPGGTMRTMDT